MSPSSSSLGYRTVDPQNYPNDQNATNSTPYPLTPPLTPAPWIVTPSAGTWVPSKGRTLSVWLDPLCGKFEAHNVPVPTALTAIYTCFSDDRPMLDMLIGGRLNFHPLARP